MHRVMPALWDKFERRSPTSELVSVDMMDIVTLRIAHDLPMKVECPPLPVYSRPPTGIFAINERDVVLIEIVPIPNKDRTG